MENRTPDLRIANTNGGKFFTGLGGFSITDTVIDHLEHLWTGTNAGQI